MGADCQFCGTSVLLPENGAVVVNKNAPQEVFRLPVSHEDEEALIYDYQTLAELLEAMGNNSMKNNDWVHILNKESSQSFPISLGNLYERLKHPDLAAIIHKEDFTAHLQPIIEVTTNEIFGYESLLRTSSQEVNPGQLFSFAHQSGLHSMLDQKARRAAVKAKSKYIEKGKKVFINFLPSTIYVPEFCLKHTFQIVEEFNVDPADIVFEVVETEKITDVAHLKSIFDTYKASGMKVALDDVGSGYSTIEMLTLLKPDFVKVDRAYIKDCHINEKHQSFLNEVVGRANHLGIKVLAEGIEKEEEWSWLQSAGIDFGQGYYLGRPKEIPEKEAIITS
ncbi:EAL domain-containing protein [Halobacillus campisalis]|uniref:EAL domain-containing protein n=1 Tax=Halobacillus campisalis TaxID=435909 RepID=A0ABW2K291_9BACI|nr:EAL domain-containing protein [Halobacillus campisalis]